MVSGRVMCVLAVCVSLSLLNGCAAFRSGETQPPATWPISKEPGKQSISLLISGEAVVNERRQDVPQQTMQIWQEVAEKAYKESGLFSDVKIGAAETDLRAEIHVLDQGEGSMGMAFVSGLTLTLIPCNTQEDLVVKTTLKNKDGQELGTYEKKENMDFWIQLFLIFIMPFYWPNTVATDMLYDLNRATIGEAYGAGLLRAQSVTDPWSLSVSYFRP